MDENLNGMYLVVYNGGERKHLESLGPWNLTREEVRVALDRYVAKRSKKVRKP